MSYIWSFIELLANCAVIFLAVEKIGLVKMSAAPSSGEASEQSRQASQSLDIAGLVGGVMQALGQSGVPQGRRKQ